MSPVFISFALGLGVMCLCERFVHAVICLFLLDSEGFKGVFAHGVIGGGLNLGASAGASALNVLLRAASVLWSFGFWFLVLFLALSVLNVTYEEFPSVWLRAADYYDARVGPFVHAYLLLPVRLLNLLFKGVVPLYNGVVWIVRVALFQGVLPVLWGRLDALADMGTALVLLGRDLSLSLFAFWRSLPCDDGSCLAGAPPLDLVTPMSHVRTLFVLSTDLIQGACPAAGTLWELGTYPLVDLNLAECLHNLGNAALQLFIQAPIATAARCHSHGQSGTPFDFLMCTPDLEPAFNHLAAALTDLGELLDGWLNLAYAVAVTHTTEGAAACEPGPPPLGPDSFTGAGLLSGPVAVVGLTESLMASANGTMAYFYSSTQGGGTEATAAVWPFPVDPAMGMAAVATQDILDTGLDGSLVGKRPGALKTTSLLGCACEDSPAGIRLRCATLTYPSGGGEFDVWFQDGTWTGQMRCAAVEVSVRSVRWPVQRYEGPVASFGGTPTAIPQAADCISRGTCSLVDATIWLVPRCSDPSVPSVLCSAAAVGTNCFPYCLAARVAGAGHTSPVLTNARVWRAGKQLLHVDCSLDSMGAGSRASQAPGQGEVGTLSFGRSTYSGVVTSPLLVTGASAASPGTNSLGCVPSPNTAAWVQKNATGAQAFAPWILLDGQPFAIAGDTLLISRPRQDGSSAVMVERLTGDQHNTFTVQRMWNDLPAAPERVVPRDEIAADVRTALTVPLDYRTSRVLATNSRNYVFYAVNPALQLFTAYLNACRNPSALPQFQFMVYSSYGPLRVYRVRAYCQGRCAGLSAQVTLDSFSDGTFGAGTFNCSRRYNATISALEYVNEQNVAVTVQVADRTFDVATLSGTGSRYVTYWLNPETMALRGGAMWPSTPLATSTVARCAAQLALPRLGSLGAEVLKMPVSLATTAVGMAAYTPGLVKVWLTGGGCPLQSRGHSVLVTCGAGVYSLDDFFDSLDDATAYFWGVLDFAGGALRSGRARAVYGPLDNLLSGMARYGRASISITSVQGVQDLFNTPALEQMTAIFSVIRTQSLVAAAGRFGLASAAWSRYSVAVFLDVGQRVVRDSLAADALSASALWRALLAGVYDRQSQFEATVASRAQYACSGLEMMFGGANPWGRLVSAQCDAGADLTVGMLKLFLALFVDAPMVRCVCKESAGRDVRQYGVDNCVQRTPTTLRPVLLSLIEESNGLVCTAVVEYTKDALSATLDPWFASVYRGMDALGESIDYAMVGFDADAGQCLNYRQDPNVVVLVPSPADYFQGCARVSSCRAKCASQWDAFQEGLRLAAAAGAQGATTLTTQVQSLFFPEANPAMVLPGRLLALTQGATLCPTLCSGADDACLAAAVLVDSQIRVLYFCVPLLPSSSVYAASNRTMDWASGLGATATRVAFFDPEGGSLLVLGTVANGTALHLASRAGGDALLLNVTEPFPSTFAEVSALPPALQLLYLSSMRPVRLVGFVVVRDLVLLDVAVRTRVGSRYAADQTTVCLRPDNASAAPVIVQLPSKDMWQNYAVVEYADAAPAAASLLLWPATAGYAPKRVAVSWTPDLVRVQPPDTFSLQGLSLAQRAAISQQSLLLASRMRVDADGTMVVYGSNGDTYDWLRQLRIEGAGLTITAAAAANSQPVQAGVTVATRCDGTDCRACATLQLRALCSAYQSCAIFRCVGTPINQKRPLCGVGLLLRSTGILGVQVSSIHQRCSPAPSRARASSLAPAPSRSRALHCQPDPAAA